jgi:lipopolysaccharide/colanic/teichoic acid biosynthesis glycosyltransferase
MIYTNYIKVFFDKLIAIVLGILLFPVLILIYLLLFITQGSPVFFTQMRTGKNKRKFRMYKFRTLTIKITNDLSIAKRDFTFFGNAMRRSGLDELPQFFNIIKGEMSFVGPRPMPVEYESKYNNGQLQRFLAKPGITGWAQVHGRNDTSWEQRFEMDIWYVEHSSSLLDMKIIWMTGIQLFISLIKQNKKEIEMQKFNNLKIS